nr:immunoglobulin heavy chain junction region [Mus musculus]
CARPIYDGYYKTWFAYW